MKKNGFYVKINKQIVHLTYDRTEDPGEKIGPEDREELRALIENEILEFEKWLRPPYEEVWRKVTAQRTQAT